MTEYETPIIDIDGQDLISGNPTQYQAALAKLKETLNKYGKDDWEYVTINVHPNFCSLILKRKVDKKTKK